MFARVRIRCVGDLDARFDRLEERLASYHGETRELIASMLMVVRDNAIAMQSLAAGVRELRYELRESGRELRAESRESRDQLRANTEAVLRLLDRFGDDAAPA